MTAATRYRDAHLGGCLEVAIETRADGTQLLRSLETLQPHPARLTDRLEHWAREAPTRPFVARRGADGDWVRISYAQMLERAQRVGQALLGRGLSVERPLAILSGNGLEHLTLALGAMWVGIPYAPISTAYSLVSEDFARLRQVLHTLTPGMVFASGPEFGPAIAAAVADDVEVVLVDGALRGRPTLSFDMLLACEPGEQAAQAHAATGPHTIVKFLFTSGSTQAPKAVVNTQRMMTSNLQMLTQVLAFLADEPPVFVDWLPWSHTFGGNHNVGLALWNGGTFHIDDGRPTPAGIGETLRNLREISPTIYFNVPRGFEEIVKAMDDDATLRDTLFRDVQAFMYAGAGLAQGVWDRLDAHAERTIGTRVRMVTSLGMTETAPSCTFALRADIQAGWIGLPAPGVDVKLSVVGDKTEIRFRGPNVMPGYWREPKQTAAAFDDEGFYRTGDAVRYVDAAAPELGLFFDGRLGEDFKLSSGTFVSVGPLRASVLALGSPWVTDSVVAGLNRDDVGLLIVPRLDECRRLAGADAGAEAHASADAVLAHPAVRAVFQGLVDTLWRQGSGGATRVARAHVLVEPPSLHTGELTDKGSLNQGAVLRRRAAIVDALFADADPTALYPTPVSTRTETSS